MFPKIVKDYILDHSGYDFTTVSYKDRLDNAADIFEVDHLINGIQPIIDPDDEVYEN